MTTFNFPTLTKGHGTANDFLLYADAQGVNELSAQQIAALTDRHRGFGADGLIRAVRTDATTEARGSSAQWFMDYRNADGSIAEMCGNGLRVFVAFLQQEGLIELSDSAAVTIATRAGDLAVERIGDQYRADMGTWSAPGGTEALSAGFDVSVVAGGMAEQRPGLRIDMPNPHVVVALEDEDALARLSLLQVPSVDPAPEHGTNVEFVVPLGEREITDTGGNIQRVGVVRMRVHERGVGETLSCGTGACAAALAVHAWFGDGAPSDWQVLVPGGTLGVRIDGQRVFLAGPAELVGKIAPVA